MTMSKPILVDRSKTSSIRTLVLSNFIGEDKYYCAVRGAHEVLLSYVPVGVFKSLIGFYEYVLAARRSPSPCADNVVEAIDFDVEEMPVGSCLSKLDLLAGEFIELSRAGVITLSFSWGSVDECYSVKTNGSSEIIILRNDRCLFIFESVPID